MELSEGAGRYSVKVAGVEEGVTTLAIGFGTPGRNDDIVRDAAREIASLRLPGGRGVKFNGPASLPVAMALGHSVAHLFGFVACYDPKLGKYVVAISHDPETKVGDLLD